LTVPVPPNNTDSHTAVLDSPLDSVVPPSLLIPSDNVSMGSDDDAMSVENADNSEDNPSPTASRLQQPC
jgi:hypothetical protein